MYFFNIVFCITLNDRTRSEESAKISNSIHRYIYLFGTLDNIYRYCITLKTIHAIEIHKKTGYASLNETQPAKPKTKK